MAYRTIETYQAEWNTTEHKGRVALKVDGAWNYVYQSAAAEFSAIVDLLRNEKPVYLADDSVWGRRVVTSAEEIGEEES